MAAATRRVNRGNGHSYYLDGEPIAGVTAILRDGVPKGNLVGWAARSVAGYAVDHWDELAERSTSKRLRELERAAWNERDAAAGRGSTVHRLAERLAAGEDVEVPDELTGHVDAYLAFAEAYNVAEVAVEATVIYRGPELDVGGGGGNSRPLAYMGTVDLLAYVDERPELVLVDWKTGGTGIWPEVALQLAAYAHAETMLDGDGLERPMPTVDRALAVWLRADGYDVYPVDIGPAVFRTFQYAQQVAAFTVAANDRRRYIGDALPPRQLEAAS